MGTSPVTCSACRRPYAASFEHCPFCRAPREIAPERCEQCGGAAPAANQVVNQLAVKQLATIELDLAPPPPWRRPALVRAAAILAVTGFVAVTLATRHYDRLGRDRLSHLALLVAGFPVFAFLLWLRRAWRSAAGDHPGRAVQTFAAVGFFSLPASLWVHTLVLTANGWLAEPPVEALCEIRGPLGNKTRFACDTGDRRDLPGSLPTAGLAQRLASTEEGTRFVAVVRFGGLGAWLIDANQVRDAPPRDPNLVEAGRPTTHPEHGPILVEPGRATTLRRQPNPR